MAAEVVALFPLEDAAWVTATVASALVAAVALFVFQASGLVLDHRASRLALATIVLLLPAGGFEATATLANVHWFLVFACFWALVDRRQTAGALTARACFAAAAPMSNPMAALLVPLAVVPFPRSQKREYIPRVAFLLGTCLQFLVVVGAPDDTPMTPVSAVDLPDIVGGRVAGAFLVGDRLIDLAGRSLGTVFPIGSFLVVSVLFLLVIRSLGSFRRRFALLAGCYSAIFTIIPLVVRGGGGYWPIIDGVLAGSRYFILPTLFLFVVLVVYVDRLIVGPSSNRRTILLTTVGLWCATVLLVSYSFPNPRSEGPDWRTSLLRARRVCERGQSSYTNVRVAPDGWSVRVSCQRLA
jgi:hypothetical protein